MHRHLLTALLLAAMVLAPHHHAAAQGGEGGNWPNARGDGGATRYSPLTQIDRRSVAGLKVAWVYHTGDASSSSATNMEATPVVVDDVLYTTTASRKVVALDAATGREIWKHDFAPQGRFANYPSYHGPSGLSRGVAFWADAQTSERRILVGSSDGRLLSIDAVTGELDPAFGQGGTLDLRAGIEMDLSTQFYGVTSPPALYRDVVIIGVSNGEGPPPQAPGDIRAFDVRTGRELWRFHTIPRPGEFGHETWSGDSWKNRGGANSWGGITVDSERGTVFAATGSVGYDYYGGDRPGENLFANSILALDALTGERIWHYQTIRHDIWDYDLAHPPTLVTIGRDGEDIPAVAQTAKTGFIYVLHRETGEPLFPIEERPVPSSPVPGEALWPTQPVPLKPAPITRQHAVTREEVGGITPEHDRYCKALFDSVSFSGGIFFPTQEEMTLWFPGTMGGAEWSGGSYDPASNYLYVSTNEVGALGWLQPSGLAEGIAYRRSTPRIFRFWDENKYPCQEPPWGALTAIDLASGEIAWRVPLGEFPALRAQGVPATGTPNLGGSIVTAGGVVFIASTMDEQIRGFDARNGAELWKAQLPAGGYAAPATYLTSDGRQYLVIAAGGGGKWQTRSGDAILAFSLE